MVNELSAAGTMRVVTALQKVFYKVELPLEIMGEGLNLTEQAERLRFCQLYERILPHVLRVITVTEAAMSVQERKRHGLRIAVTAALQDQHLLGVLPEPLGKEEEYQIKVAVAYIHRQFGELSYLR